MHHIATVTHAYDLAADRVQDCDNPMAETPVVEAIGDANHERLAVPDLDYEAFLDASNAESPIWPMGLKERT